MSRASHVHVAATIAASVLSIPFVVHTAYAAQRTFVSTGGTDINACSLSAPCRGFAKAITVTDPGGELVVLDSGGYGSVTINTNVTIISPAGVYAGVSVLAGTDGITVAAPATKVVLRGLTINGVGGNNGIRVQAGEVHVESTVISNMGQAGILVEGGSSVRISGTISRSNTDGLRVVPGGGAVSVLVRDSEFSNNSTAGIGISPISAGATARVTIERTSVTKNGDGVVAAPGGSASSTVIVTQSVASENAGAGVSSTGSTATVFVRESAITRNATGLQQSLAGVLNACGANLLVANAVAQSGAISTSSCLDVASATGTVTNVGTGAGLTGGPITSIGTLSVPNAGITAAMLAQNGCASGQMLKWNGAAWACANDIDTNSGGTVTNIATGAGLAGGPITTTGTVNLAATNLLPTVACAGNLIPRWNGAAWSCADQGDMPGNITLVESTATAGNILKGTTPFIHDFGTGNTFIGEGAGNFTMTGRYATATGYEALMSNTTGDYNTADGYQALANNKGGQQNTAVGYGALYSNSSGTFNTAVGFQALDSNTLGNINTAIGAGSLLQNTDGINNTAIGWNALQTNSHGGNNTAVGVQALFNEHGNNNTAMGLAALSNNILGDRNVGLGAFAGGSLITGSDNIYIGSQGVDNDQGIIRIGKAGTQVSTFIAGVFGATTGGAGVAVVVDSNGQLGTISSSRRYKDDIADMGDASTRLMQLRPVTFYYKSDRNLRGRTLQYGLIAEEVADVYPGLVARNPDGRIETVNYQFLPPMLLNELQKQQRALAAQAREIADLKRAVELLLAKAAGEGRVAAR